jgi:hypothetical protein
MILSLDTVPLHQPSSELCATVPEVTLPPDHSSCLSLPQSSSASQKHIVDPDLTTALPMLKSARVQDRWKQNRALQNDPLSLLPLNILYLISDLKIKTRGFNHA